MDTDLYGRCVEPVITQTRQRMAHTTAFQLPLFTSLRSPTILCREEVAVAIEEGEKQLEVLKRQSVLSQLYPSAQSVMES